jgi:hypothetical protein
MNSLEKFLEMNEGDLDARMRIVMQNGNDGLHYEEMTEDQQWDYVEGVDRGCKCNDCKCKKEVQTMSTNGNIVWTKTTTMDKDLDPNQLKLEL